MITEDKWQKITWARDILHLPAKANLREIKDAYRSLCKQHHPDTSQVQDDNDEDRLAMHEITEAYNTIMTHCESIRFPLQRDKDAPISDEDWWMSRFGQDPLWGKGGD